MNQLRTMPSQEEEIAVLADAADRLETAPPQDILAWAVERYRPKISMACSFGMQSVVLIDMLHRAGLLEDVEVFYLDTGVLFQETHRTRLKIMDKYGIHPIKVEPELTINQQGQRYGEKLWDSDPQACCRMRKVEPMKRYLVGKRAWITGMRRSHGKTRDAVPVVMWDRVNGLAKINPVAVFDDDTLWGYIKANGVPYNKLYDCGYPSIGCEPCTKPVKEGDDPRSGRWAGQGKTECGIHLDGEVVKSLDSSNL